MAELTVECTGSSELASCLPTGSVRDFFLEQL